MKVYFVRHGESVNNLQKKMTGWYDAPLTEKGERDAEKAGKILSDVSFGKIYSSDLSRAQRTAQVALPGCAYETTALIREINVGDIANTSIALRTSEEKAYAVQHGYKEYGGESRAEFQARIRQFLQQLELQEEENIAVFAHGGCLMTMLDLVVGTIIPRDKICCNNCAVGVFEYKDGHWALYNWINVT